MKKNLLELLYEKSKKCDISGCPWCDPEDKICLFKPVAIDGDESKCFEIYEETDEDYTNNLSGLLEED